MTDLIVRPIEEDELGQAASLVADIVFDGNEDYTKIYNTYAKKYWQHPQTTTDNYHAAFIDEQLIALAHTIDFRLRYGRAALNVVGISLVCTHPEYRQQGYASALLRDMLTAAAEQGAHLVLVNSTSSTFFRKFGFSPVWARYTAQIPVEKAITLQSPLQIRVATPDDLPMMERLYKGSWGSRLTVERDMDLWRWHMTFGRGEAVVITDEGQIKGYIWHIADDFSNQNEVVAASPAAIATCLSYSARRWQAADKEMITWSLPPDDVIIPHARQLLPVTLSATYSPSDGWLGRIIDGRAILDELLPEIIAQAHAQDTTFDPHELILKITPDGVDIGLQHQARTHCHLSLRDFMQILFGSLRPESLAVRQALTYESVQLLNLLFPPRIAAIAAWDWF